MNTIMTNKLYIQEHSLSDKLTAAEKMCSIQSAGYAGFESCIGSIDFIDDGDFFERVDAAQFNNVEWLSAHLQLPRLAAAMTPDKVFESRVHTNMKCLSESGVKFIVIPFLHGYDETWGTAQPYVKLMIWLNDIVNQYGMQLCFHNSSKNAFRPMKAGTRRLQYSLMSYILDKTSINIELDLFWCQKALRTNTAAFISRHAKRIPLIHLNDTTINKTYDVKGTLQLLDNPYIVVENEVGADINELFNEYSNILNSYE
jgi:sugar phosphate isomerase/epimerase